MGHILYPFETAFSKEQTEERLGEIQDPMYRYLFSNGACLTNDDRLDSFHRSRAEVIFPFLDRIYGDAWNCTTCIDLACNQGWFTTQVALRGARQVVGVDIRESHINASNVIKHLCALDNVTYQRADLFDLTVQDTGQFDITLFLGILYHIDNPILALNKVRSLTRQLCVIETQVLRQAPDVECMWGAADNRKGPALGLIEADDFHAEGSKAHVIVPSINALYKMLYAAGFDRLYLSIPHATMNAQYQSYDRVVVFAEVL